MRWGMSFMDGVPFILCAEHGTNLAGAIEKEAERISEKRKSCSKTTGSHNQKSE